ncbi:unnamed protein product, partial [Heligmosomoides polygyrus]|uniref:MADF domain-containing protein n=1 Tax=Heligmosomoides polygyrus TaxID=6339 RepID=A0A183FCR1_HELPZ
MHAFKSTSEFFLPYIHQRNSFIFQERPVWNDTLRGILVALVKDRRPLWDARFRTTKERTIQLFREIAAILSNQD